jgi:hypothetical protein
VPKAPYTVDPVSQLQMSWLLRRRLRQVRERQRTGLLMQGIIRTPVRSVSSKAPLVSIREGDTRLGMMTLSLQIPKWVLLASGEHQLTFAAIRPASSSSFTRTFDLGDGDVLVAVCEPIQPWTIFGKSPSVDHWYLDVISHGSG